MNQQAEVTAQPDVAVETEAVRRASRSWQWSAAVGVVVLLIGGTGYFYFAGLNGNNPAKAQMTIEAVLKARGLDGISVEISKDWVATVSGSVANRTDEGRALGIVESNKDVKHVEDRIVVASVEGGSAAAGPNSRSAQSPSMKQLEELIKQGTFE